jgi:hypothetical protein
MITADKAMFLLSDILSQPMLASGMAAGFSVLLAGMLFIYNRRLRRVAAAAPAAESEAPAWHGMSAEIVASSVLLEESRKFLLLIGQLLKATK